MSKKLNWLKKCRAVASLGIAAFVLAQAIIVGGETSPAGPTTPAKPPEVSQGAGGTAKAQPEKKAGEEQKLTLWRIIKLGGPLMWPLFALSFALVASFTYFLLSFTQKNMMPPLFLRRLEQIIRTKRVDEARMFCAQNRNAVSHIVRCGLEAVGKGRQGVLDAMNGEGSRRGGALWLKISFLSDIAVVAPMLGLLGTVMGMFQAFMSVSASGMTAGLVNPAYLTGGVAQAVITTIVGLMIAIPATLAYSYLRVVVQKIIVNLELISSKYSEMIAEIAK
jgi:biopolymer transport protein ExbB